MKTQSIANSVQKNTEPEPQGQEYISIRGFVSELTGRRSLSEVNRFGNAVLQSSVSLGMPYRMGRCTGVYSKLFPRVLMEIVREEIWPKATFRH